MATTPRPASIPLNQLSKAVDDAVQRATATQKFETQFSINGLIWGRWLREAIDTGEAEKLATSIAAHVQSNVAATGGATAAAATATKLQPAVLVRNGHIICGFLPDPSWNVQI
jgi:hypothetical protein